MPSNWSRKEPWVPANVFGARVLVRDKLDSASPLPEARVPPEPPGRRRSATDPASGGRSAAAPAGWRPVEAAFPLRRFDLAAPRKEYLDHPESRALCHHAFGLCEKLLQSVKKKVSEGHPPCAGMNVGVADKLP